jgi:glucose-6-phosphate isomerase
MRYVSNIDPNDIGEKVKGLDPKTTLIIVVSKLHHTETLTTARAREDMGCSRPSRRKVHDGSMREIAEANRTRLTFEAV